MVDRFTNINRNSLSQQPLNIDPNERVGVQQNQPHQGPGSVIGQEYARSVKTAQQIWENSVHQFVQDNQGQAGAAGSHIERDADPVDNRRAAITPSMLKDARKNKLKELPVFLCARPLAGNNAMVKGKGLHGFVAIGQPGMANVKGAKVFSYGADDRTSSFKFNSNVVDKLENAKQKIKEDDRFGNTVEVERPIFSKEAIESFRRMALKHENFHSFADFHRAYYADRMEHEENNNPTILKGKQGIGDLKANYERLKRDYENLPDNVDKKTKKEARKNMRTARTKYRTPLVGANFTRHSLRNAINEDAVKAFETLQKTGKDSSGGGLPGDALRGWQPGPKDGSGHQTLANSDVDLFEKKDAHSKPGVKFEQQHGVKATDVIEVQRQQWMADNYRDEKAGQMAESGLAPELLEDLALDDPTKELGDTKADFDENLAKTKRKLKTGKYAPITDGDKDATSFGKDARAIRDKRTYAPLLVVKNEKRGLVFLIASFFKKVFRSKASKLRNEGNCNAAAGSLVRMAARRGGKRIEADGGKHQHGLSKDVLWNPTPNLRREPQTQTEFVTTGKQRPQLDPNQDEIVASGPDSGRLMDVTGREVQELRESVRSINQAYRDLHETNDLMNSYAPKPKFRQERFQAVRDGMKGFMAAIQSGDDEDIREAANKASKAASDFHETRMDQYFKKKGKEFDSSSQNIQELRSRASKGPSGERKMLLSNSIKSSTKTLRDERRKLIENMEHTLSKPEISDVEAQKLLIGAKLLAGVIFPDAAIDDLVERAQAKVREARAAGGVGGGAIV